MISFEIVNEPHQIHINIYRGGNPVKISHQKHIHQQKNEVLSIVESNTVVYPWAVMIHIEYAFFT